MIKISDSDHKVFAETLSMSKILYMFLWQLRIGPPAPPFYFCSIFFCATYFL